MGIQDRDYMRDKGREKKPPMRGAKALPFIALIILATFMGMFLSLRVPVHIVVRFLFAGCILMLGATQIAKRL